VLNLHPSPLPRGRGPDPLFWLFREPEGAGAGGAGATVHLMDRGLDSGPILLQERFALADGTTGPELELRAASVGAGLLARAVRTALDGEAEPRTQEEADATAYPMPTEADFVVTPDRPARWAFNFLRGTAGRGYPHRLVVGERAWLVRAARGYDPEGTLPAPFVESGGEVRVRCAPGVLTVTTYDART
jgi:methionyl-tRNA formyltransferase